MGDKDNFEENEDRIANYLDHRMSPDEEVSFIRELGENAILREQYENELIMNALLRKREAGRPAMEVGEPDLLLQPADEFIGMLEKALEKETEKMVRAPVVSLRKRYIWVGAAAVAIIVGVLLYPPVTRRSSPHQGLPERSIPAPVITQTIVKKDSVFAALYTPYSGSNDPVQVSRYLQDYKRGRYDKLLAATDASVQESGTDGKDAVAKQYLHLYKGLAYLALDHMEKALAEFNQVLRSAGATETPYYEAQWYAALALLKNGAIDKATGMARQIVQTASPHRIEAGELLQLCHSIRTNPAQ